MKLLSGLAIVAYAQSGDGSADVAVDVPSAESSSAPAFRQRAISSGGNSDYEYYYEQSALGRRKKKKKKKIIFNIPQRPTTTRAPPTTTRAPLPAISNDYNMLFGANGSFGSKVSDDYLDYNGGSAGVASDRWSGFGGSDYAYDYSDGFGEITVGNTFDGKGQFEFNQMTGTPAAANSQFFNLADNTYGEWNPAAVDNTVDTAADSINGRGAHRWDNDDINKYWEFMHRQWGHQQENRLGRNFAYDPALTSNTALVEPSRWYHVTPENVINNLNRGYLNYQYPAADGKGLPNQAHFKFPVDRRAFLQAGRHGHPWGIVPDKEWDLPINVNDGSDKGGDGAATTGGAGNNKYGWYAQPWLWDAENVPGISDFKLWNGVNYGTRAEVGTGNTSLDAETQASIQHTFGFIDWRDANKDSIADDNEGGIIPGDAQDTTNDTADSTEDGGIRFQDVSPARAPWYGRRFDASWELGDSPAHFVFDGILAHGGKTPFATDFAKETSPVSYFDRTGTVNNQTDQAGWQRYYSGYRWFPGIANFPGTSYNAVGKDVSANAPGWATYTPNMHGAGGLPENTNQVNDPAKLKCHQCNESAHLEWDDTYHTFKLVSAHSIKGTHYIARDDLAATTFGGADSSTSGDAIEHANNVNSHTIGVDLWKQCFDTLQQKSCEYSSGVCFVEERRVWGYVTQVQAGCQQSQACYMQKYQNFVVEAGRQCWPGDAFGEEHRLATRPDDMRADQWIYNIIKGGLMLAQKDIPAYTNNDHRHRKFPSHYFSEMENDNTRELSSLVREETLNNRRTATNAYDADCANCYDFREKNNWVDKFHTGFSAELENDPAAGSVSQAARATLTDGNFGVGRSGYESAFSTLLHYPTFLNADNRGGKFNNYIYKGGSAVDISNRAQGGLPDAAAAYVPADLANSNQVYGMGVSQELKGILDAANKGQTTNFEGEPLEDINNGANDSHPEVTANNGQTTTAGLGDQKDLDFNGQGGADGSIFSERSQFYQNEASRFASENPIDDQWRNPDQHNYVRYAGTGGTASDTADVGIFRQHVAHLGTGTNNGRWDSLHPDLTTIIENQTRWQDSSRYTPIEYKNGLVEASKCHQCCNTDHNCNWNWQPTTKLDWNFAYVWRYQAIDERSNSVGYDEVARTLDVDTTANMGEGANQRHFAAGITTLSQTIQDHHFNFPPYMANHHVNRGGVVSSIGDPSAASATVASTGSNTYTPSVTGSTFDGYFNHA